VCTNRPKPPLSVQTPRLFPGLPQADIAPGRLGFVAPEQGWDHIRSLRARSFKASTTAKFLLDGPDALTQTGWSPLYRAWMKRQHLFALKLTGPTISEQGRAALRRREVPIGTQLIQVHVRGVTGAGALFESIPIAWL
jgi:hypothetical protein